MVGWVKMERSTLAHPIISKDAEHLAIWTYLMLSAAYAPSEGWHGGKRVALAPGQLICDRATISKALGCSESKVQRVLKSFESEQLIVQQMSYRSRLVTMSCDFFLTSTEREPNAKRTASERKATARRTPGERIYKRKEEGNKQEEKRSEKGARSQGEASGLGGELVKWIEATYPSLQQLEQPMTAMQGAELRRKFKADDIKRILRDMANNPNIGTKVSTYSTFLSYADRDFILEKRGRSGGKLLSYTEMVNSLKPGQKSDEQFERVAQRYGEDLYRRR
ncbi:MAG: hypothetical protein SNH88_04760 [Rikenellaceae bacterium]